MGKRKEGKRNRAGKGKEKKRRKKHTATFKKEERKKEEKQIMAAMMILKTLGPMAGLMIGESYLSAQGKIDVPVVDRLLEDSFIGGVPKAYGLVILANLVLANLFVAIRVVGHVSKNRQAAEVKYPTMMVEKPKNKAEEEFNWAQRVHGNILETFPAFLICSAIGGLSFPFTTAVCGLVWIKARDDWMEGYKIGPEKRYSIGMAMMHWMGLIGTLVTSIATAVVMLK